MITIRAAQEDDAGAVAAIYRPIVEETAISYELEAPGAGEMRRRIVATTESHPWVVAEQAGEVLGYAYGSTFRARPAYRFVCESSIYVARGAHGRGVGTRLYGALVELLRRQGFATVYAGISLPNEASVRLHERLGFRSIGVFARAGWKLGRWHDAGFWQLALADGPPAGEPVPWSQQRASADTRALLASLAG